MSNNPQVCDNCNGAIKSDDEVIDGLNEGLFFCSLDCYGDWLDVDMETGN